MRNHATTETSRATTPATRDISSPTTMATTLPTASQSADFQCLPMNHARSNECAVCTARAALAGTPQTTPPSSRQPPQPWRKCVLSNATKNGSEA